MSVLIKYKPNPWNIYEYYFNKTEYFISYEDKAIEFGPSTWGGPCNDQFYCLDLMYFDLEFYTYKSNSGLRRLRKKFDWLPKRIGEDFKVNLWKI